MTGAPITGEDPAFTSWAQLEAWEKDRVAKCCAMAPHALNPVGLLLATAARIHRVRAAHAHLAPGACDHSGGKRFLRPGGLEVECGACGAVAPAPFLGMPTEHGGVGA